MLKTVTYLVYYKCTNPCVQLVIWDTGSFNTKSLYMGYKCIGTRVFFQQHGVPVLLRYRIYFNKISMNVMQTLSCNKR
jgi:hypothetical protein